ncbi:MAG TPA: rhodanese-like domain-containing protein [Nitrolancea sp.]|nr:rhodanese-like domain-containing protein [Nitrolancea sp.]
MPNQNGVPVVPEIDPLSAWERVKSHGAMIVDVREAEELDELAVPGVTHIPLGSLQAFAGNLPGDRDLFVICRSGVRSAFATQFLIASGFQRTLNLTGGVIAWAQAELPYVLNGQPINFEEADSV